MIIYNKISMMSTLMSFPALSLGVYNLISFNWSTVICD